MTKRTAILALAILGVAVCALAQRPATIYKLTPQHNNYEIGITCTNGGDPTGTKIGDMVIIGCK